MGFSTNKVAIHMHKFEITLRRIRAGVPHRSKRTVVYSLPQHLMNSSCGLFRRRITPPWHLPKNVRLLAALSD